MYTSDQIDAVLLRASRAMLIISDRIQDNFLYLERNIYDELRFKQRDIYVLWKCLTDTKPYRDDYDTYDALINVLTDKCADVDSYNPNYTTLNPNYQNISGNTPNPHPSDYVTLEEVQELLADYALLSDRVLTGLEYSYLAPTVTISAGTYKIGNVEYSANSTPFPITPTTTGLLKYVRFYATTSGTIAKVESTPSSVAEHPDIPDGTLGLYSILVNDAGVDGEPTVDLSEYRTLSNGIFSGDVGIPDGQAFRVGGEYVVGRGLVPNQVRLGSGNALDYTSICAGANEVARATTGGEFILYGPAIFSSTASVATPTADAHAVNKGFADATYAPISSVHYRGTFLTLAALQTAIPVGNPGDEALVDAGVGTDAVKFIWDDSDGAWIAGGGGSAASFATLTGSVGDNAALVAAFDAKVGKSVGSPMSPDFIWVGTQAQYDALTPATDTIYHITDAEEIYAKIAGETATGTALVFTEDKLYGTVASPETGNITADAIGAKLFASVMVIHNSGSAPTFDSKFTKLSGSGDYVTGVLNYIYCQYINSTKILYSISQEA